MTGLDAPATGSTTSLQERRPIARARAEAAPKRGRSRQGLGRTSTAIYGQFSKVKSGKMSPAPGRFEL